MTQVEDQASQAEERSQETRSFVRQVRMSWRGSDGSDPQTPLSIPQWNQLVGELSLELSVEDPHRLGGVQTGDLPLMTCADQLGRNQTPLKCYYAWTKGFMEAGKERLTRDSVRDATRQEIEQLKRENLSELKQLVGELSLELHRFKKTALPPLHDNGTGA